MLSNDTTLVHASQSAPPLGSRAIQYPTLKFLRKMECLHSCEGLQKSLNLVPSLIMHLLTPCLPFSPPHFLPFSLVPCHGESNGDFLGFPHKQDAFITTNQRKQTAGCCLAAAWLEDGHKRSSRSVLEHRVAKSLPNRNSPLNSLIRRQVTQ